MVVHTGMGVQLLAHMECASLDWYGYPLMHTTMLTKPTPICVCVQGYARVYNMDQETALPRPDEDLRLEAALAIKANGAVP